jgi:NAD(P)-dependent dehydrogenase (short-subunit alcohol dehydrogenase family)
MKIIIIGASGTIGKHVALALKHSHEILTAGSKSGDYRLDVRKPGSIKSFFENIGSFDALISTTGSGHFGPLSTLNDANFRIGIDNKMMGQINLVLEGQHFINPNGSFTLSSGVVFDDPVLQAANLSAVNGAIEGFIAAAAIELANGVRINGVSPGVVEDAGHFFPFFPGHIPVKMESVVQAYIKCVLGAATGKIVKVR